MMSFIRIILLGKLGLVSSVFANPGWPEYSWNTVPVYIHFGSNRGLTDEEIAFVASRSNFISLEKRHGVEIHGSTEKGIESDAIRMKKVNPKAKVMYYWNTFLDYTMFDAHAVYESHPEWWLRTKDGSLDKKWEQIRRYDLSNSEVQEWWSEEVRKAVVDGSCDGVFADAFPQIASQANVKLWGQAKYDAIQEGLIETLELTREKIGLENVILYNGIRNTDTVNFGMEYLDYADGATIEHFAHFKSQSKESIARDIAATVEAGKQGEIVVVKGWPGFNFTQPEIRDVPYETLLERARANIEFPLACFLVAAQEHSYFCYGWGYREDGGSLDWYEEFDKPLGPPKGDSNRDGWVYTRSFEHADVWVDLESKEACIDWR